MPRIFYYFLLEALSLSGNQVAFFGAQEKLGASISGKIASIGSVLYLLFHWNLHVLFVPNTGHATEATSAKNSFQRSELLVLRAYSRRRNASLVRWYERFLSSACSNVLKAHSRDS